MIFNFFTSKKDMYKNTFFIQIINIRSCAKNWENAMKSLKLVYTRKKLKIWFWVFTRLRKTVDLIKNPLITIAVRNVRLGFINRKNTWASRNTIWAPYNQFLASGSQFWTSGRILDIWESIFDHCGCFVSILGHFR